MSRSRAEHQARAVAFRTHQCFVRHRTELINALRGHLGEFGIIVLQGPANLTAVVGILADETNGLPTGVREMGQLYLDQIRLLTEKIDGLMLKLREAIKANEDMRRLCTAPGVGSVTVGAILAFAPDLRAFKSGRNFAAWLGLVPRQHSTGGKTRLGGVSKMGQSVGRVRMSNSGMLIDRGLKNTGESCIAMSTCPEVTSLQGRPVFRLSDPPLSQRPCNISFRVQKSAATCLVFLDPFDDGRPVCHDWRRHWAGCGMD